MDAVDAADTIREASEKREEARVADDQFRRRAALVIGVLAMLLAIAGLGGANATKDTINSNIQASDTWAFYQAKNIRQTSNQLAADQLELTLASQPNLPPEVRADLQRRLDGYKATVARYESDPATGEGKKELTDKAHAFEGRRERAQRQDPNFDFSQALFQIAIVLGSVSIVAAARHLLLLGIALGGVAIVLLLNGFLLFFDLPIG